MQASWQQKQLFLTSVYYQRERHLIWCPQFSDGSVLMLLIHVRRAAWNTINTINSMRCRHSQPARLRRPRIALPHHAHAGSSRDVLMKPTQPMKRESCKTFQPVGRAATRVPSKLHRGPVQDMREFDLHMTPPPFIRIMIHAQGNFGSAVL